MENSEGGGVVFTLRGAQLLRPLCRGSEDTFTLTDPPPPHSTHCGGGEAGSPLTGAGPHQDLPVEASEGHVAVSTLTGSWPPQNMQWILVEDVEWYPY